MCACLVASGRVHGAVVGNETVGLKFKACQRAAVHPKLLVSQKGLNVSCAINNVLSNTLTQVTSQPPK